MIKNGWDWLSEFPGKDGQRQTISYDINQATVASYKSLTGGHAMLYLEYLNVYDTPVIMKIHLTAGLQGSGAMESTGSGSSATGGGNQIYIDEEDKSDTPESNFRESEYYYTTYVIPRTRRILLEAAIARFRSKVDDGRYRYRIAGGVIGRLTTLPRTRGVNCADFLIKVLKEAGIANIDSKVINTPKRVAGH